MDIELPFPAKILWPNGRTKSLKWKAVTFAAHKQWAWAAARSAGWIGYVDAGAGQQSRVKLLITVYPKPRGPFPDKDNAISAFKAYQDGIAKAMGLNDSLFDEPTLQFAERTEHGKFIVQMIERGAPCAGRLAA